MLAAGAALLLAAGVARAVPVPGAAGHVEAGGWIDGLAVVDTGGAPRQRPQGTLDLGLDARGPRWLGARLELRGWVGGPYEDADAGFSSFDSAFQDDSPGLELNEAYVDVHLERADLRAGIQKLAWGKLDGIPPTDVVNPRDYHDPLVRDVEERKIGVPALLGTWYLPDLPRVELAGVRASLVYVPIAVPSRLALEDERWFPTTTVAPSRLRVRVPALGPAPLVVPVRFGTRNDTPPRTLEAGGVGLRLGGTWRDQDWDLYHYTGPETGPNADLRVVTVLESSSPLRVSARSALRQATDRVHMTGADWAAPVGAFTLRAEAAWFVDRPVLRLAEDLIAPEALARLPVDRILRQLTRTGRARVDLGQLFPSLDAVEWGVGADTVVHGFVPLLQVSQIVLLEAAPRLVIGDPETRITASLRKRLLSERLELETRGVYSAERGGWFLFPRVSYLVRDDLRLRIGYLAVGGPRTSLFGQFGRNDEVVFQARWTY